MHGVTDQGVQRGVTNLRVGSTNLWDVRYSAPSCKETPHQGHFCAWPDCHWQMAPGELDPSTCVVCVHHWRLSCVVTHHPCSAISLRMPRRPSSPLSLGRNGQRSTHYHDVLQTPSRWKLWGKPSRRRVMRTCVDAAKAPRRLILRVGRSVLRLSPYMRRLAVSTPTMRYSDGANTCTVNVYMSALSGRMDTETKAHPRRS